jgi:hypothetical protein
MSDSLRNKVLHNREPSVYQGDYQITDEALKKYKIARDKFGSTEIILSADKSFNVKDYQYVLDNGKVGMNLIPINDYGNFETADGGKAHASELVDAYIRKKMNLKPTDPIYAYMRNRKWVLLIWVLILVKDLHQMRPHFIIIESGELKVPHLVIPVM